MRFKNLDLAGVILLVAVNVGWAQLSNRLLVIGVILALPFIFILPGYALTQILFRGRSVATDTHLILRPDLKIGPPVGAVEQIIFSLGLSLAIDVLVGFILNVFPIGLKALSWTLSLGLVTTVFAFLAAFIRQRNPPPIQRIPKLRIAIHEYVLFVLAILVVTVAVWGSIIRSPAAQVDLTQFWILPADRATNSCAIRIGIHNQGSSAIRYHLVMTINGTHINTWQSITLTPQEEWDRSLSLPSGRANTISVEGQLYQSNKPVTIYKKVNLIFHLLNNRKDGKTFQCSTP